MFNNFGQYIVDLYNNVPSVIYEGLVSVFCIGTVLILAFIGFRRGSKYIAGLLLVEYVFLLFCVIVFLIVASDVISGHNFHPFWSYAAILQGRYFLIVEKIMNVVVFMPVGLLLGVSMRGKKADLGWKGGWLIAFLFGFCISVSIETLQYFTHRGFSEFDDVFHNTLGCVIGYGMWKVVNAFVVKIYHN